MTPIERARASQRQRKRRLGRPRIDYYPSAEALAMINSLRTPSVGGDASSILNRIVVARKTKRL